MSVSHSASPVQHGAGFLLSMKTCSKCKKDQPRENFVKSPRYLDGLYPICKSCRKATLRRCLKKNPLCRKCKKAPHSKSHVYCESCSRENRGRNPIVKFHRKIRYDGVCPKCGNRPRLKYFLWCKECKNEYQRKWLATGARHWDKLTPEQKKRAVARGLLNTKVHRGKIKRQPCEVCGNPKVEGHHHNGYDREHALDVRWLCKFHHDEAERVLKSKLTEQPLLL